MNLRLKFKNKNDIIIHAQKQRNYTQISKTSRTVVLPNTASIQWYCYVQN